MRNPDSLPTGRNLYGFDPSRVPTRQAWDIGVAAFDAWMKQHRAANKGQWPEKIAFTLWAGETMRHQGVMEAQALHALGVKPRWDDAGRVTGLDTVPPGELKRPRLDVQNLRDTSEVITESASSAIAKEMQTRYLHPQWISAQKSEGYSGTLQVLKTAQFLWGWQVTAPQTVRQDHWQSLHNVYVRDQYKLGTREWLEGDNRAAFAQTLERMLDAVRLNYWQPDAATKKELLQAYQQALKATGLRESNRAVQRFAAAQLSTATVSTSVQAAGARPPPTEAKQSPPDEASPTPVRGLKLEPQAPEVQTPATVVNSLAGLLGVALLLALGGWQQSRRWRQIPIRV